MKDAAQNVVATARLLNQQEKENYVGQINETYRMLKLHHQQQQEQLRSLDEARRNRLKLFES
jgi:5-methyltetrahydrofolate--homocysteine methyltransferase